MQGRVITAGNRAGRSDPYIRQVQGSVHCRLRGKIPLQHPVSAAWKKACPSANFLVKFTKRETDNALDGDEGLELAAHNYGCDEWWVLLNEVTDM